MSTLALQPRATDTFDLLLRERQQADALCADRDGSAHLLPRLVAVSSAGVAVFAVVQAVLLHASGPRGLPEGLLSTPIWWSALVIFLSFEAGLAGAQVAGLPSYYFYALLAGIRTHGWRIVVESVRARATAAVVLLGLLPVYLAATLGFCLVFDGEGDVKARAFIVACGYTLPFVAGLAAPITLLRSLLGLAREAGGTGRRAMPVLLAFGWTGLFAVMAPVGVVRALDWLSSLDVPF